MILASLPIARLVAETIELYSREILLAMIYSYAKVAGSHFLIPPRIFKAII